MRRRTLLGVAVLICYCLRGPADRWGVAADSPPAIVLPDTTPPGKSHFDSTGPKVGEQLPDLPLYELDGTQTSLGEEVRYPTLLLTSSYTCPTSRSTYPSAAEMAERLGHRLRVTIIYVIEAHPKGDPSPYSGVEEVTVENRRDHVLCAQPRTLQERLQLARQFKEKLKVKDNVSIYADAMNNAMWKSLGGGPNMAFLLNEHGVVLARQGWFDARSMEEAAKALIAAVPPREKKEKSSDDIPTSDIERPTKYEGLKAVELQIARSPELVNKVSPWVPRGRSGDKTLLHVAVIHQRREITEFLIKKSANVNLQTKHTPSALHLAAKNGNLAIATFLIQHRADVNLKAHGYGPTPLQEALIQGNKPIVDLLTQSGAKANFFTDVATGNLAAVRSMLEADPTRVNRPDGTDRPPLAYAAATRQTKMVNLLLDSGARDLPVDRFWQTAYSKEESSAIWWAVHQKNLEMVRLLCDRGSDPNLLDITIFDNSLDIARELLAHKADPNRLDLHGYGPLHNAIVENKSDFIQMFLKAGADPSAATGVDFQPCYDHVAQLETPLHLAAEQGYEEVVAALIANGAKVNALNARAQTALHTAVGANLPPEKTLAVVKRLLAAGANVNAKDREGKTPLDLTMGNVPLVKGGALSTLAVLLQEHGAKRGADVAAPNGVPPNQPRESFGTP